MKAADSGRRGAPAEQLLIAQRGEAGSIDAATPTPTGLLARFRWSGDRYQHRLELGGRSDAPVMQSMAREPFADWPDDPPLQQLSIENLGEQTVALGVGSAGTSHWSLSIEALPGPAPALRYDLACRCHTPPAQLASTFQILAAGARFVVDSDETAMVEGLTGGTLRILPEPSIGDVCFIASAAGQMLAIAANLGRSPQPGTLRWGFRIVWQAVSSGNSSAGSH